jgi:hypothetical protein
MDREFEALGKKILKHLSELLLGGPSRDSGFDRILLRVDPPRTRYLLLGARQPVGPE